MHKTPTENLPPAELKKLRNKQRKAKKKAELETQQSAQAQARKDLHNKSRNQAQDGDPEAPQLDELIPEKLARPEEPLEKAMDFLQPLQSLASERIETHLLAFEIYYRKNKVLLMLQAIKRAGAIDANNAALHLCIVKFAKVIQNAKDLNVHVQTVLKTETAKILNGKTAAQLIQLTLEKHGKSLNHVVSVAKGMVDIDATTKDKARQLITSFDMSNTTLEVSRFTFFYLHPLRFIWKSI